MCLYMNIDTIYIGAGFKLQLLTVEKGEKHMIKFLRNYRINNEENQEEENENKGFSLVELIIVIAIMAILVAVLAPQFLQYVSRSRNSTDAQNATAIATALQTYYATNPTKASGTVLVTSTTCTANDTDGWGTSALTSAGISNVKCKSTSPWSTYTITYTFDSNGNIVISYSSDSTTNGTDDFAYYMENGTLQTTSSTS